MGDGRHARRAGDRAPGPGRYRGRRRATGARLAGARRLALVLAVASVVLTGTGALARTLPDLPALPEFPLLPVGLPERGGAPPAAGPGPDAAAPATTVPTVTGSGRPAPPPAAPTGSPPVPPGQAPVPSPTPTGAPLPGPTPTAPPAGPPQPSSYEAEAAELSGFVSIFAVPDASGGEVVGLIGRPDNHVRFTGVTVAGTGDYQLTLYYVSVPDGQAEIIVNGGAPAAVDFPALGDAHTVGAVSVPVQLVAGGNEVWFGRGGGPAPALDRITVG